MPPAIASDATSAERTMVLRQKCFIANLDSEKGPLTAGAVTA
jgi:hypothetical protein